MSHVPRGLYVCMFHTQVNYANTDKPNVSRFGGQTRVDPRNSVLDGGPYPPRNGALFGGYAPDRCNIPLDEWVCAAMRPLAKLFRTFVIIIIIIVLVIITEKKDTSAPTQMSTICHGTHSLSTISGKIEQANNSTENHRLGRPETMRSASEPCHSSSSLRMNYELELN